MRLIPDTRSIPGMWRWRPNPLRRRSDLVEAWAGLAAVAVAAVGAPVAGVVAGRAVDSTLQRVAATQRAQRHEVRAAVVALPRPRGDGPVEAKDTDDSSVSATGHRARVAWTGTDHRTHYAQVSIVGRHTVGTTMPMWVDRANRPVDPPLDLTTATSNAIAAGAGAAVGVAALVMAVRSFIGWRILRRRLAVWERDWFRVSQEWAGAEG